MVCSREAPHVLRWRGTDPGVPLLFVQTANVLCRVGHGIMPSGTCALGGSPLPAASP